MNKQELLEKIKALKPDEQCLHEYQPEEWEAFQDGFDDGKCYVELIIEQLDEPVRPPVPKPLEIEKPVVPEYVADMIVEKKEQKNGIVETIKNLGVYNNPFDCIIEKQLKWITENQEDFAKAWLYGYEIEKDKLYTAKLKLTDEYLCCESQFKDLLHYKVPDSSAKEVKAYHFTEDDLVKYHIWGNDNYEVKKVEE